MVQSNVICLCEYLLLNFLPSRASKHTKNQCVQILELYVSPIFPKVSTPVFALKVMFSKQSKRSPNIWATFVKMVLLVNFQKSGHTAAKKL